MASESRLFSLSPVVAKQIRDFRLKGHKLGTAFLSFLILKGTHEIACESGTEAGPTVLTHEDEAMEDLADALPDNTPRYVLVSYDFTHPEDGRRSSPLFLVYWIPRTASTELATLYASAKVWFAEKCDVAKVLEIRDADDLTKEYIEQRLGGSK